MSPALLATGAVRQILCETESPREEFVKLGSPSVQFMDWQHGSFCGTVSPALDMLACEQTRAAFFTGPQIEATFASIASVSLGGTVSPGELPAHECLALTGIFRFLGATEEEAAERTEEGPPPLSRQLGFASDSSMLKVNCGSTLA